MALGTVEVVKRFLDICESPYHGLNFCQGTYPEMLEKPGETIYDVIRYGWTLGRATSCERSETTRREP